MKKYIAVVLSLLIVGCGFSVFGSVAESLVFGDANSDGKVNVKDATHIQRYVAMINDLDETQFRLADVNADGKVNIKDATMIQKFVAKLIASFPAGENSDDNTPTATADEESISTESTIAESITTTGVKDSDSAMPDSEPIGTTDILVDPTEETTHINDLPTIPQVSEPIVTDPEESKPQSTTPAQTTPVPTNPPETEPVETKPVETKPLETKPVETKPADKPQETVPTKPSVDEDGYFNQIIRP